MSRILLGVSGGIAAYKALELVRLATAAGHAVRVVQTPASRRFVGAASFAALTGAPVLASEFERDPARGAFPDQPLPQHEPLSHLELVANADVYLIAPASANTIAKLAGGLADNLLSSCALAATCPLVLAPAMNNRMYEHAATQANLRTLRERGVSIVEPGVGRLASKGEEGVGRLAEPERLLAACERALVRSGIERGGTEGRTERPARARHRRGHARADRQRQVSRQQLLRADGLRAGAGRARTRSRGDAPRGQRRAAVAGRSSGPRGRHRRAAGAGLRGGVPAMRRAADGRGGRRLHARLQPRAARSRGPPRARLELVLEPTADVLAGLAARRRDGQTLVGFAAEHGDGAIERARAKLAAKALDAVVVNDISRADIGFDVDANEVTILSVAGDGAGIEQQHVPRATKAHVAEAILDAVESLRGSRLNWSDGERLRPLSAGL